MNEFRHSGGVWSVRNDRAMRRYDPRVLRLRVPRMRRDTIAKASVIRQLLQQQGDANTMAMLVMLETKR